VQARKGGEFDVSFATQSVEHRDAAEVRCDLARVA
jgi:hypothetical protein